MGNVLEKRRGVLAALVVSFAASGVFAQDSSPAPIRWRFQVTPYVWGPGVKGTVQIQQSPQIKVDIPFSDAIGKFQVGVLGRFDGRKGDFGVSGDALYLNTDVPFAADQPPIQPLIPPVAVRQFYGEAIGYYRLYHAPDFERAYVDFLVGVRYFNIRTSVGSLQGGAFLGSTSAWLDLIGGFRGRVPIVSWAALVARGDVGGLGSKMSINAEGALEFAISKSWAVGAGYRYQDYDFATGLDADRRAADLAMSGPLVKVVFTY
jgi:hypothetical protein